jgi:hypothetical protein
VKGHRITRSDLLPDVIQGRLLAHDLREANGRVAFAKGSRLAGTDCDALARLDWSELHLIALDDGDLDEVGAGHRLARAIAGEGLALGELGAGHWPLTSSVRGIVHVDVPALDAINAIEGLCAYTLYDGQVVDAGEPVSRAKIVPFAIRRTDVERGEAIAARSVGVVRVRQFLPLRVGAVVQESLGDRGIARFRAALAEKLSWLGAIALEPLFVPSTVDALADALRRNEIAGANVIAVAGARAMDPLDPAFEAVRAVGGEVIRHGVPAHPGSLCWVARSVTSAIVGMPSCGLFSRATVFDLLLPRLLLGESPSADQLSRLGHGGFLTSDMAYRFPPYRQARARGAVE